MYSLLHLSSRIAASMVLLAIFTLSAPAEAQNYENFDNLVLGNTPGDGDFWGQNTNPWTYQNCRGDVPITGKAITLVAGGNYARLTCVEITGVLQTLSFDYMQVGPNPATVFVLIDGDWVASFVTSGQSTVVNSGIINIGGIVNSQVEFRVSTGGEEVALDNITWTVTPDNMETFDNLNAPGGYFDSGSFTGVNGFAWSYSQSSTGTLDGPAIILEEGGGSLSCSDISTGMYSFSFDYVQSNYAPVYLEIRVNGDYFTTISSDDQGVLLNTGEIIVNEANGVDGFPLSFEISVAYDEDNSQSGGEVTIDNLAWTNLAVTYTEFTGTGNWSDISRWVYGPPNKNFDAFIKGNATVDVAATAGYVGVEPQWSLTLGPEILTATTLTIRADATGSGSLIGSSSSLEIDYAFMTWYIQSGVPNAWHLLSSPVPNQGLTGNSTQFTPAGSSYDFYAWDEPTEMWLNRKVSANNINSFVPGKGYLVAYEDISANKSFGSYEFNSGEVIIPLTAPGMAGKSTNGIYAGYNLIGNPYPSSIDWKDRTNLDKNALDYDNNGYNMYIWNDAVSNYGAYNDATTGDNGTNGVGRYIPPLQGFFVQAQTTGNFVFNDGARVHSSQQYMKSGNEEGFRLAVTAPESAGKDEILLDFGHEANHGGADKWYSMSDRAPSLYMPFYDKNYSIRFLSSVEENSLIPVSFKAGIDGEYRISANYNTAAYTSVNLKDLLSGNIHDLSTNPEYTFTANIGDDANRFVLVFGTLGLNDPKAASEVQVYSHAGILYLNSSSATPAEVKVYNLTGQLVMEGKSGGNTLTTLNAAHLGTGIYMVTVVNDEKMVSRKVAITK